jgi:hypothetical protein
MTAKRATVNKKINACWNAEMASIYNLWPMWICQTYPRFLRCLIFPPSGWLSQKSGEKARLRKVKELQIRIAKAVREGRHWKARSLQWLLTHSFYAKLLAVKRVVTNKGKRTPGIDCEIWETAKQKIDAIGRLRRRNYRPQPISTTIN